MEGKYGREIRWGCEWKSVSRRRDKGGMRGTCERGVGCGCVREGEWVWVCARG